MPAWDTRALLWINQHHEPWLDAVLYPVSFAGEKGLLLALLFFGLLWMPRRDWPLWAGIAVALMLADRLMIEAVTLVWFRDRPFLALDGVRQVGPVWYTSSFPSGHAHYVWLVTVVLGARRPSWLWGLVPFALLTCYARPYFGMHYPSDVVAGALMGVVSGAVIALIQRAWLHRLACSGRGYALAPQQAEAGGRSRWRDTC